MGYLWMNEDVGSSDSDCDAVALLAGNKAASSGAPYYYFSGEEESPPSSYYSSSSDCSSASSSPVHSSTPHSPPRVSPPPTPDPSHSAPSATFSASASSASSSSTFTTSSSTVSRKRSKDASTRHPGVQKSLGKTSHNKQARKEAKEGGPWQHTQRLVLTVRTCDKCKTQNTPEWRKGPNGPGTLCNACGLQYRRSLRQKQKEKQQDDDRIRSTLSISSLLN
ncbi:E3 ubiquitin-protein ligase UPL1 isoform X1 [Balamuthia mandrillaris]